jgi:hypothetical protein
VFVFCQLIVKLTAALCGKLQITNLKLQVRGFHSAFIRGEYTYGGTSGVALSLLQCVPSYGSPFYVRARVCERLTRRAASESFPGGSTSKVEQDTLKEQYGQSNPQLRAQGFAEP